MSNDIVQKINEIISLVDCNCGGKHQAAFDIIKYLSDNNLINENQKQELDQLRVYQEYNLEQYGYDQRLILIELYKQIYFLNKYPYSDLNTLLLENNIYLRMKNCLYWVEFFYKSELQSILRQNLNLSRKNEINNIVNNVEMDIVTKINNIRNLVSEDEVFHYIKLDQIKVS